MRPLVLQLENFTSFRTRQRLDLNDSDLFAIAGPTGSGKSSLLDALVFALYGRVPRMGKSCAEMISLGRDRMSVSLDFRCGDGRFRVTRVLRRTGRTEAQLERIHEDGAEALADGVRKVDEEIQRILGLGYDAFTQAVILPQGEFARFLKSDPAQRQKILRDLLRLQVYEKMRKAAGEEAARLDQQVRSWETVLQTEYGTATPEAIRGLEDERATLVDRNARLSSAMATAEAALLDLRRRRDLTAALEEARQRLLELQAQASEIRHLEARLHAGRRAAGVVPRLDASEAAATSAERAVAQAAASSRAAAAAIQAHDE
ncbi:MAG: AAA family ATPase, partial [bacterium]